MIGGILNAHLFRKTNESLAHVKNCFFHAIYMLSVEKFIFLKNYKKNKMSQFEKANEHEECSED